MKSIITNLAEKYNQANKNEKSKWLSLVANNLSLPQIKAFSFDINKSSIQNAK